MKYKLPPKQIVLAFSILFFFGACQELPENGEIELEDEDMIAATELANEYLGTTRGNFNGDLSVTVIKLEDGILKFGTDSDAINDYQEITEETITATVVPGEYVFWFCGGGLSDLGGIEFDESSMLQLVDAPSEIYDGKMWVLTIPEDIPEDGILKYDIVYQYPGNPGPPIILDPKLKLQPKDIDED